MPSELILTFPMSVRIAVAADVAREQAEMIKRGEYGPVWPEGSKPPKASKTTKPRKNPTKKTVKKSTKKGRAR